MNVQHHVRALRYSREKNRRYPASRKLGGPQNRFGVLEKIKLFAHAGNRTPDHLVVRVIPVYEHCLETTSEVKYCSGSTKALNNGRWLM